MKTGVNPPRTPVTKGSNCIAAATVPNVCKMPGPPAPFVPLPLPNIAMSSNALQGATKKVKIEGQVVAIKGASFKSVGDVASQGTGGGLVSSVTQGACKFVAPGSLDVKAEGGSIHLMGDATTNNNSNPPNAATVAALQAATSPDLIAAALQELADECNEEVNAAEGYSDPGNKPKGRTCTALGTKKHKCCETAIIDAGNDKLKSEVRYQSDGRTLDAQSVQTARAEAAKAINDAKAAGKPTQGVYAKAFKDAGGHPHLIADVVVLHEPSAGCGKDNVDLVFDFKFNCGGEGKMSKSQSKKYQDTLGQSPTLVHASW